MCTQQATYTKQDLNVQKQQIYTNQPLGSWPIPNQGPLSTLLCEHFILMIPKLTSSTSSPHSHDPQIYSSLLLISSLSFCIPPPYPSLLHALPVFCFFTCCSNVLNVSSLNRQTSSSFSLISFLSFPSKGTLCIAFPRGGVSGLAT